MPRYLRVCVGVVVAMVSCARCIAAEAPETPRIDSVEMLAEQPHAVDGAVVWYDDFDDEARQAQYPEKSGELVSTVAFGGHGKALEMRYAKGERGTGGRKLFFGDSPIYRPKAVRTGEVFTDVYWRVYVKHQRGWTGGGPAKLSRATSMASSKWQQAMIAHVWSSGESLTLDPASGVRDGRVVTERYNDFPNLRWLGNRPASQFKIHSTEESGRWVCVEARARLNTPGKKDGINQLWIDGRLEAERKQLDWRGTCDEHGINAVFLEAYWNNGSPVDQSRWIDNFVVSTEPIGPVVCSCNPVLIKTAYEGPGTQKTWQVEVAGNESGSEVVWRSGDIGDGARVAVDAQSGRFAGALSGATQLAPSHIYFVRVRQQSDAGTWSNWSGWHQPFRTEG